LLDFDNIDDWAPRLSSALGTHVPDSVREQLVTAAPRYIEDARDLLLALLGLGRRDRHKAGDRSRREAQAQPPARRGVVAEIGRASCRERV